MTITTSPPPTSRRRRVTRRRMADGLGASSVRQHAPDALRHLRELEAERRLVELACPLRRAGAQHDAASQADRQEGGLARVAAGSRDAARPAREAAGRLEDGELAH